jgi:hypothetical protein
MHKNLAPSDRRVESFTIALRKLGWTCQRPTGDHRVNFLHQRIRTAHRLLYRFED